MRASGGRVRVLVLYCEEGDGHASAAAALAEELRREPGVEVVVRDALRGGLGRVIPWFSRDFYEVQVRWLRWTYGLEYLFFARLRVGRAIARRGLAVFGARPLRRMILGLEPDVVVSTHPSTTNVSGALRRRGRLSVPVVATITDFGVHGLWAHRGVDLHLVMHERCASQVEMLAGGDGVRVAGAIVAREFRAPPSREDARRALALPPDGCVVVVAGGGLGVGRLVAAVEALLAVPEVTVVCLSGRNGALRARLEERFAADARLRVLPFTGQVCALLAAADALIDATVGVTCLEALTVGCPIIVFGAPWGHSRDNARALVGLDLALGASSPAELRDGLDAVRSRDRGAPGWSDGGLPAASLILHARPREARVASSWRRPLALGLGTTLAALVMGGWTLATPSSYALLAETLRIEPLDRVLTGSPEVALVVVDTRGTPSPGLI